MTRFSERSACCGYRLKRFGRIDGLVHSVPVTEDVTIMETDEAAWDRAVGAHSKAAFLVSREVARVMVSQGEGRMVFLAPSGEATGVYDLVRRLGRELAPCGIGVNAVGPGRGGRPHGEAGAERGAPRQCPARGTVRGASRDRGTMLARPSFF